jgi:hypothetical protein
LHLTLRFVQALSLLESVSLALLHFRQEPIAVRDVFVGLALKRRDRLILALDLGPKFLLEPAIGGCALLRLFPVPALYPAMNPGTGSAH